ncbi:VaFE repeat-containing surface-anchored protein [Corynebacterium aurimucosum]|uniref:VaFE repeat-containing surface-anchored protein n=1 Tax=Corynebacterium aurimucosum TaxID=169292 RepID=UPI0025B49490|nr:VaFE repeat-containing surface-anchored protein [Corynebacterium aurimucosum]
MNTYSAYKAETAGKAPIPEGFRDAAINLAVKLRDATEREDKGAASRYSVYLAAVLGADQKSQTAAVLTITGEDRAYKAPGGFEWYPYFNGSPEEFKQLTGYGIETFRITDDYGFETDDYGFEFVADPTVDIPAAPADSFITIVGPDGNLERGDLDAQRVMPPDQPGLPDDEGESVEPKISTNADFANGATEVVAGAQVNDTVKYEGLVPGKEYTLNAELISKKDGKTVLGEGEETFTPDAANGEVVVEIVVDESVTEPVEAAVAFEELTSVEVDKDGEETPDATPENPNPIAEHKDINDEAQTVTSEKKPVEPKISTNADFANGATEVVAGAQVNDTVKYEGLVPGKEYTLNAELISKKDGKTVLGEGEETFTPDAANGEVVVEIVVDESVTEPVEAAVAFEELTSVEVDKDGEETPDATPENPNPIAEHKDINDEAQTVTSEKKPVEPKISTNADFANGATEVVAGAQVNDTVKYEGLVPGKEYTLNAELISKKDGKTVLGEGEETFTPDAANGEVVVEIVVDESVTEPVEAAVAFEELTSVEVDKDGEETPDATPENPNPIAEHKDINDEAQTVTSEKKPVEPKISTNADFANGATEVVAGAQVNDTVKYEGLVPGKEYTLNAELISKKDGKTVLGEGEETFTPDAANGEVVVEIVVDESVTEPVEAAVAFEELTSVEVDKDGEETPDATPENPNPIAEHKDINDEAQTVTSEKKPVEPKISTNADFANGATEVVAGAQVNDTVKYEGLVPGKEYTLNAELISKKDGKTVLGEGEETFTPDAANGEVVVEIVVDESVTEPVEAAVAFEELTSVEVDKDGEETPDATPENPNPIAEHKDINDQNQTVPKPTEETTPNNPGEETTPNEPDEETTPNQPGEETTPNNPGEETTPNQPGEETTPNQPGEETTPNNPGEETTPNQPGEETTPNNPGEETTPNQPGEETTPNEPGDEPSESTTETPDKGDGNDKDDNDGSSKKSDLPWWLLLIPGLGLIKLIIDGGNGGNGGDHDGGKGTSEVVEENGRGGDHGESTGDNAGEPSEQTGDNTGRDDREVTVLDATPPEDAGMPLPSNAERVEIKHVPSGATKLEPGMKDFIK